MTIGAVDASYRGQGVFPALVEATRTYSKLRGSRAIRAGIYKINTPSRRVFIKSGWIETPAPGDTGYVFYVSYLDPTFPRRTGPRFGEIMRDSFLSFALPDTDHSEIDSVAETIRSGWVTTGPKTQQFETEFAATVGARHAIAVNSCTAAMHLALEALGLQRGDEVITTPYTFAATAEVIRYFDARPVLVDVDERSSQHARRSARCRDHGTHQSDHADPHRRPAGRAG